MGPRISSASRRFRGALRSIRGTLSLPSQGIVAQAATSANMARPELKTNKGGLMRRRSWSRREVLTASVGAAAATLFAQPARAALPPPATVTTELIAAARKEGKVSYYAAIELGVAERLGKIFEAKYPGIAVRVERSGAERIFQRIAQEQGSGIHAVDIANSTDVAHYLEWKKNGWLSPYLPEEVTKHF